MERKLSAAQRDAIILDEVETWLNIWNPELRCLLHDWKTSHSMAQMRSMFAKSMGILGITKNMHRFHPTLTNMNLNMQPGQIPGQIQHQKQNNAPFERLYGNLPSNMSPDNNSENNNFYAHLPWDQSWFWCNWSFKMYVLTDSWVPS